VKNGDSIRIISGEGDPFRGQARCLPAALLCCGAGLYGEKPLVDFLEEKDGAVERNHRWCFDADTLLEFKPQFAEEQITVDEFARRFNNDEWCTANPHHPITHLRSFFEQITIMEEKRKTWKPALLVRNGNNYALIGPSMGEDEKKEALEKLAASTP
jgi:hypothetical protein